MNDQTLEEFDQGWVAALESTPFARLIVGLAGRTRLGERPAPLTRLAALVGRPAAETEALVREATSAHVEGESVHWDDPFPGEHVRRTLYVGGREIPMRSGCAPDLFVFAAVLDVPFHVEETCAVTGRPIRVDFAPDGCERVDPPETVSVLMPVGRLQESTTGLLEDIDTRVCAHQPFLASAQAADPLLAAHPGSRAFTVREMFERPFVAHYRDHLRPLIHGGR
jgi:hypothetical protein